MGVYFMTVIANSHGISNWHGMETHSYPFYKELFSLAIQVKLSFFCASGTNERRTALSGELDTSSKVLLFQFETEESAKKGLSSRSVLFPLQVCTNSYKCLLKLKWTLFELKHQLDQKVQIN